MHRRQFLLAGAASLAGSACGKSESLPKEAADQDADGHRYALADLVNATRDRSMTTRGQVQSVVDWTHRHLEWTATDYQDRSVSAVLSRGGGNCREQAIVVRAALEDMNIATRQIREINLHTKNKRRGADAAELIEQRGLRASVFGEGHNDHVWIEYWDEQAKAWTPSDPTLNLVGFESWIPARLGFGQRPVHAIIPSRDMVAPILVLAETDNADEQFAGRNEIYLINRFAQYVPAAAQSPAWSDWVAGVEEFEPIGKAAFLGETNLHDHLDLIERLRDSYFRLRAER